MSEFGIGIYSLTEAARLIQFDRRTINRWLFGYDHAHQTEVGLKQSHSDPLWHPQYASLHLKEKIVGFRDLLELRIVREFVNHGVPLIVIRKCMARAKEIFDLEYPLTTKRFTTDGKTIYAQVIAEAREDDLLDLRTNQFAFKDIIKPSLYAGIEYEGDFARRWYPDSKKRDIVIDPNVQFGKPIIEAVAVPTTALYASYLAEKRNKQVVARSYDVHVKHVEAAVRFEERLAA